MSSLDTMTDEQFERHALQVLGRELGADGLARFLRDSRFYQPAPAELAVSELCQNPI